MTTVYLLLGSNIDPVNNTRRALSFLKAQTKVVSLSSTWQTPSVGSPGPDFINLALEIETQLGLNELKNDLLRPIEAQLGRVRTADKNAPRPIDLDVIIFNGQVQEMDLFNLLHLALPMAELVPGIVMPSTGQTLQELASQFRLTGLATPRPDLSF